MSDAYQGETAAAFHRSALQMTFATASKSLQARLGGAFHLRSAGEQGSVLMITLGMAAILAFIVAVTLKSTSNKYLTAYQWASWQEALQGAESGADMAMAEMRKDVNPAVSVAFAGWKLGTYRTVNGKKATDPSVEVLIDSSGNYIKPGSSGTKKFTLAYFTKGNGLTAGDYLTYSTQLTPHAGEGNTNLRVSVILDAPATLTDAAKRQWLRIRATGSTDLTGGQRVSEEKLDNRLRKLGLFFDKVLGNATGSQGVASRRIEVVAKPVTMYAGALMAQCNIRNDNAGLYTNSFSSDAPASTDPAYATWPWKLIPDPANPTTSTIFDMSVSDDITNPLGKNGDIGSNAFPVAHDHNSELKINADTFFGNVGNNYAKISGLDSNYYPSRNLTNPNPKLITTKAAGGVVTGDVSVNFYRDLPRINPPAWTSPTLGSITSITGPKTYDLKSTDPNNPDTLIVNKINLDKADKLIFNNKSTTGGDVYLAVYVKASPSVANSGEITLDDGGTFIVPETVHATVYFDKNVKVGATKETKTNGGGFDVQSDKAKDLLLLGVDQPEAAKQNDLFVDPVTGATYTYSNKKNSGTVLFRETDFTGALYSPDHNILFDNTKDGKGKRKKRKQTGNEFYGSFVGRTIHAKGPVNVHYDEVLNDVGPVVDWGFVSWFEDVDVDNR